MMGFGAVAPSKRLKLPGGDRSRGTGVLAPWRARPVGQRPCARGRVARSLSAIRQAARHESIMLLIALLLSTQAATPSESLLRLPLRVHLLHSSESEALSTIRSDSEVRTLVATANAICARRASVGCSRASRL